MWSEHPAAHYGWNCPTCKQIPVCFELQAQRSRHHQTSRHAVMIPCFIRMSQIDPQYRRRSPRALLQVAVLVRTELSDGELGQIQAFTVSVNAHGGLFESPIRLTAGQKLTLVNPHTKKEAGCRIVRVEGSSEASYAIAFEFDQRNPHFWPITFPP